ncbi:MAG TPA: FAD-binding protein [Pirellulales bacterium]|nr:FAD-binding protein [Pirellulales bacterium]
MSHSVTNFGGNLRFRAAEYLSPRSEDEVLQVLAAHAGRKIRAVGRLHSWSEVAVADEILIDLQHLDQVRIDRHDGGVWVTVGAGCQIKRLLSELDRKHGQTIPSLGLIAEQTIAGAISTGTHGSGKHSLSHDVVEVRLAAYDAATGRPAVRTIRDGPELRAARCALGCLGIILAVKLPCRPQYRIEEHVRGYATLDRVLAEESPYPLQQFFLIPWSWRFFAQHRRETPHRRSVLAGLYRLYWLLAIDLGLHLVVQFLARVLRSRVAVRFFYRRLLGWTVVRGWKVVDQSQAMLVMKHELFRHIEIELFVARPRLAAALDFVQEVLRWFDGEPTALSSATRQRLAGVGLLDALLLASGTYTHHYAICVRRVLPDDTLISMAGGDGEPYYAISLISYAGPADRAGFTRCASFLAESMAQLFAARPHWGKVCPLDARRIETLYPRLGEFRAICLALDPTGVFRNRWVSEVVFGQLACGDGLDPR